jgi:hypothetical protein
MPLVYINLSRDAWIEHMTTYMTFNTRVCTTLRQDKIHHFTWLLTFRKSKMISRTRTGCRGACVRFVGLSSATPYTITVRALALRTNKSWSRAHDILQRSSFAHMFLSHILHASWDASSRPSSASSTQHREPVVIDVADILRHFSGPPQQPDSIVTICAPAWCGPVPLFAERSPSVTIWSDGPQSNRVRGLLDLIEQEEQDQREVDTHEEVLAASLQYILVMRA